ncbi:hypothetical protein HMPREF3220_04345, partial [Citrobacter koseri]
MALTLTGPTRGLFWATCLPGGATLTGPTRIALFCRPDKAFTPP